MICAGSCLRKRMREVDLGCGKALLIKESGEFHAVGHKCPHYGAPLVKGVLSRGRVRCPWHGACFSISTGDIEDFPGLDSLPRFQVKIEKEKVYIRASKQALQTQRRTKMMAKCISLSNYNLSSTNVLIIGAGAAGLVCAETLRQEGFSDRIVMCTMDRHLPYDRPKLSKSMDSHPEQIALRPKEFFCTYDIEVLTEMQVAAVDVKSKIAVFKDGFKMEYNKLLIATGNTPKTLSCKGKEMENVFNIRTPEDANRVVKLATSKNVVIVGASFLGMEVAAYLAERAHSVSLVELEHVPFKKFFGERVGRAVMKMFENNRVKFYMQTEVSELREQEGKLKEVVLKSGKVLRADVCVVGVGAVPATGFLKQSGINIDSKGFIVVNKMMQTNIPGVFAAGDAVTFPLALRNNKKVNVPHWQMAHMHGRIAALNMLAHGTEISTVPYLWTALFGKSIRYAGHGEGFDDVVIQGDLDELKFVAFYTNVPHAFSRPEGGPLALVAQNGAWWWMCAWGLKRYGAHCITLGIPRAHPPLPGTCTPWVNTCCRDGAPAGTQGPLHTGHSSECAGTLAKIAKRGGCVPRLGRAAVGMFPSCSLSTQEPFISLCQP
ncbi:apoptosis-inducing factor 3 isoform X10 [Motacilla alba alba]|uniref:apoptosis-inducing factor 3 isoform X10 n=1 Tax=Motacilla alba alba TaxID=1094192 RepID=UPI0018D555C9|nr:apoptosis-inducing factor 3 isoform X10 [Motacilla alba alba]